MDISLTSNRSDMRDYINSEAALGERFQWRPISTPQTEERKRFEGDVKKWQEWHQERPALISPRSVSSGIQNRGRSGSIPVTSSSLAKDMKASSSQYPLRSSSQARRNDPPPTHSATSPKSRSSFSPSLSSQSTLISPSQRISRSMRVFVAWKDDTPTDALG